MAVLFSSDAELAIHRTVDSKESVTCNQHSCDWETFFEVDHCCEWIHEGHFRRVALQFPDEYLSSATLISRLLSDRTKAEVFILADTSYGSCCVDEITALHYNADSIIHFGHSCLSPSGRLPTLFIYGKGAIDVSDCCQQFKNEVPQTSQVLLVFSVEYLHVKSEVEQRLSEHFSKLILPGVDLPSDTSPEMLSRNSANDVIFKMYNRHVVLPSGDKVENYVILYIGEVSMFLTNLQLILKECLFYTYDPEQKICQEQKLGVNKILMRRYYLVERIKDAQIVGILVGTLSVTKYLDIVKRLKSLLSCAGKKYYVFCVGKINVAKLSNFPDVDVFVLVSCPESVILDSSEYFRPIVTPYEVELACNPDREWTGNIVLDYLSLLPGGADYKEVIPGNHSDKMDVSLITGRIRGITVEEKEQTSSDEGIVAVRDSMTLASVSGDRFSNKSWKGLDPQLGQTTVTKAIQGRKGIAIQYEEEPR